MTGLRGGETGKFLAFLGGRTTRIYSGISPLFCVRFGPQCGKRPPPTRFHKTTPRWLEFYAQWGGTVIGQSFIHVSAANNVTTVSTTPRGLP